MMTQLKTQLSIIFILLLTMCVSCSKEEEMQELSCIEESTARFEENVTALGRDDAYYSSFMLDGELVYYFDNGDGLNTFKNVDNSTTCETICFIKISRDDERACSSEIERMALAARQIWP